MNAWLTQYRAMAWMLGVILLLALGALAGAGIAYRLTASHYRPIVDKQQEAISVAAQVLASCRTTTGTMEGQIGQQNQALADLRRAADDRATKAKADQHQAEQTAGDRYKAANRYQQERTGGDPAAAAASIIDQALGL